MKHGAVGLNVADRTYIAGGIREVTPPSISPRSVDSAFVRPEDARAGMPRFDAARSSPTSQALGAKQTLAKPVIVRPRRRRWSSAVHSCGGLAIGNPVYVLRHYTKKP